jgi:hypothetical protein
MKKSNILVVSTSDLPVKVRILGENGEQKDYVLAPAGRKFGASLQVSNLSD